MRYKLIPSRGRKRSCYFEGDLDAAVAKAMELHEKDGIPILVAEAPKDGLTVVRQMVPAPARSSVRSRVK